MRCKQVSVVIQIVIGIFRRRQLLAGACFRVGWIANDGGLPGIGMEL